MDLLKTILVYMSLVYASTVNSADPALIETYNMPTPTAIVTMAPVTPTPVPTVTPTPVPTINITPNPAYKTLGTGDKGAEVRKLQEALASYGYFTGTVDGVYGGKTRSAVAKFQAAHGVSADGIAGKVTQTILYESKEVRMAPDYTEPTPAPTATPVVSIAPVAAEPAETALPEEGSEAPAEEAAVTEAPADEPEEPASFQPIETGTEPAETPAATPEATAEPTAEPTPVPTPAPTAGPAVLTEMTDIKVAVYDEYLVNDNGNMLHPYALGDTVYLPLLPILKTVGLNVLENNSIDEDEIAFPVKGSFVRITYSQDKSGKPVNLTAYAGSSVLPLEDQSVEQADGMLYLPVSTIQALLNAEVEFDADVCTVNIPTEAE